MNLRRTVSLSPDVLSQEVSGETVILDIASDHYYGLDDIGTRVWQLLLAGRELHAIHDTLLREYDVSEADLNKDLEDLLQELCELGLIEMSPTGPTGKQ